MSLCRHSEPLALQLVWKAIEVIRGQRQIANISRITKIIQREHSYTSKEILHHILRAVRDNMVVETVSLGCKGSKAGMEQEGYWIPEDSKVLAIEAKHDWYCFACHKPGELLKCQDCVKVYHKECIEDSQIPMSMQYCKFCLMKKSALKNTSISSYNKEILNKCLGFIARRAVEIAPELVRHLDPEEYMHYNYFIKQHMDLRELEKLCFENKFEVAIDFLCHAELIVHNCMLLHGENHEWTVAAKKMLQTCKHEVKELSLCTNCYYLSSTKPTKEWFSTPCRPPHRVVWAKQKGFEFWPAKVIQVDNNRVDVRFFGGHHERAWVTVQCMKSIVVSPSDLQIKVTKGWTKANEEMKEYIIQTEKVFGSTYAAQIVNFDYAIDIESVEKRMQSRAAKRQAEVEESNWKNSKKLSQYKHAKKPKLKTSLTEHKRGHNANANIDLEKLCSINSITDPKQHVKVFGEKAKLDEECARTWRYGTECITLFKKKSNERIKNAKLNSKSTQTENPALVRTTKKKFLNSTLSKSSSCNCRKQYELVLSRYKASARRMRMQERKQLLVSSTLYIQRYLKKQTNQTQVREEELVRLKSENESLKIKLLEKSE